MRDPERIKRYVLVPRSPGSSPAEGVRRYSLGRVGVSPRSALGQDRHERLEQVAEKEQETKRKLAERKPDREPEQGSGRDPRPDLASPPSSIPEAEGAQAPKVKATRTTPEQASEERRVGSS